jgi:hypothetical protein
MTQVFQGSRKESAFLSLGLDGAKAVWAHIFQWVLLPDRYGIVFRTIVGTAEVSRLLDLSTSSFEETLSSLSLP